MPLPIRRSATPSDTQRANTMSAHERGTKERRARANTKGGAVEARLPRTAPAPPQRGVITAAWVRWGANSVRLPRQAKDGSIRSFPELAHAGVMASTRQGRRAPFVVHCSCTISHDAWKSSGMRSTARGRVGGGELQDFRCESPSSMRVQRARRAFAEEFIFRFALLAQRGPCQSH